MAVFAHSFSCECGFFWGWVWKGGSWLRYKFNRLWLTTLEIDSNVILPRAKTMKLQLFVSLVYGAFLPSDNIPWKAYKRKFIKIQFFCRSSVQLFIREHCLCHTKSLITVFASWPLSKNNFRKKLDWLTFFFKWLECGIRSSVVTIDEPIFGRRKRDLYRAGDETLLDENEIEISDAKMRADTRVRV